MSNATPQWMLYGANGYTGTLTARLAKARGESPVLAGRNRDAVEALGRELELPTRVFSLDDAAATREALRGVAAVLHDAGPFSATSAPMVDACLAAGAHYLDITGEVKVFEAIFARDAEAKAAGVVLLPGVGFDVVPTDGVAAMLHQRLPDATHLELAFMGLGAMSRGTLKTAVEGMPDGGCIRENGALRRVPIAYRLREVPFPHGARRAVSIPWGDVSTAFRSTAIPNILCYMGAPPKMIRQMKATRFLLPLLKLRPLVRLLQKLIEKRVTGPSDTLRHSGWSDVWGEVRNARGDVQTMCLTTPEGYTLTADASLRAVKRLLAGGVPAGSHTPSTAFGARFVLECDGVTLA